MLKRLYLVLLHVAVFVLLLAFVSQNLQTKGYFYILSSHMVSISINYVTATVNENTDVPWGDGLYFTTEEQITLQEAIKGRLLNDCGIQCEFVCANIEKSHCQIVLHTEDEIRHQSMAIKIIDEEFCKIAQKYVGKKTAPWFFSDLNDWSYKGRITEDYPCFGGY